MSHAYLHDTPDKQRANHHPLPNYITVPHHSGMDPSVAISDVLPLPLADSLADESELPPIEHAAGGGVYDDMPPADGDGPHVHFQPTPPHIMMTAPECPQGDGAHPESGGDEEKGGGRGEWG